MRVRVLESRLIGTSHPDEGEIIDLPESVAKRLEKSKTVERAIGLETAEIPPTVEETADLGRPRKTKK